MSVSLFFCKFVSVCLHMHTHKIHTKTHITFSHLHTNHFDCKFHTVRANALPAARYFELASAALNIHVCLRTFSETMACVCVATHNTALCKWYAIILIIRSDRQARLRTKKLDQPTVNILGLWGYWHHIVLQSLWVCSLDSNPIHILMWFCQES